MNTDDNPTNLQDAMNLEIEKIVHLEQISGRWSELARSVVDDLRPHIQSRNVSLVGQDGLEPLIRILGEEFSRVAGMQKLCAAFAAQKAGADYAIVAKIIAANVAVHRTQKPAEGESVH